MANSAFSRAVQSSSQQQFGSHWPGMRSHTQVQSNLHPDSTPDSTHLHPAGSARSVVETSNASHSSSDTENSEPGRYTKEDVDATDDAAALIAHARATSAVPARRFILGQRGGGGDRAMWCKLSTCCCLVLGSTRAWVAGGSRFRGVRVRVRMRVQQLFPRELGCRVILGQGLLTYRLHEIRSSTGPV